jgi:16S rRNA G527 N7-methylase RsmG
MGSAGSDGYVTDWQSLLRDEAGALGVSIRDDQQHHLCAYLEILERWNRSVNLTSLEPRSRVRRLVAEPIWAAHRLGPSGRYLDIGSGNGSPALAWCVVRSFIRSDLVESRERRAVFLGVAVRKAGVGGVHLQHGRFERLKRQLPPPDWATVQGVRLDGPLLRGIRELNPRVRVVWFTRAGELPESPAQRIRIPESDREVLVFGHGGGTSTGRSSSDDAGVSG